jgi:hypothetical protein
MQKKKKSWCWNIELIIFLSYHLDSVGNLWDCILPRRRSSKLLELMEAVTLLAYVRVLAWMLTILFEIFLGFLSPCKQLQ